MPETPPAKIRRVENKSKEKYEDEATARAQKAIEEANAKLVEANAREEMKTLLEAGTFYALFTEVWRPVAVEFKPKHFLNMFRSKVPKFICKGTGTLGKDGTGTLGKDVYNTTFKTAEDELYVAKDSPSASRSSHSSRSVKKNIWPYHVLETRAKPSGNLNPSETNKTKESSGEIAHLIPASSNKATLHFDVARWVFAIKPNEIDGESYSESISQQDYDKVLKLIHGSIKMQAEEGKGSRRQRYTGLKHLVINKICLTNHSSWYDKEPRGLIVPILSLDAVKGWEGSAYNAVFMIAGKNKAEIENAATQSYLCKFPKDSSGGEASDDEIETARALLEATVLGLAHSIKTASFRSYLSEKQKAELKACQGRRVLIDGSGDKVKVPQVGSTFGTSRTKPVRKVFFRAHDDEGGHPAPDPLLLAVKAGYVWSTYHEEKLIAAGSVSDEDEESERSLIAEEVFLEQRRMKQKECQDQEVIGMEIIPNRNLGVC